MPRLVLGVVPRRGLSQYQAEGARTQELEIFSVF